ncbi:MAG: hypothetical protein H7256_14170 [Bdellovibrio sp.]|nr:hypothetical protein [Bdellovibrio sp.]
MLYSFKLHRDYFKKFLKSIVVVATPFSFFYFSCFFSRPLPVRRSEYLRPPSVVKNLTAGFSIQQSDSFWLRSNQDFDHCDKPINSRECEGKSWLYEIIDLVTELDSNFFEAYYFGGLALTVIISDYAGASQIFDKGVKKFPNRWELSYAAGYHALFEEKNKLKAAVLYKNVAANGGPPWVGGAAGGLAIEGGDVSLAIKILNEMIELSRDEKVTERLKRKLAETKNTGM